MKKLILFLLGIVAFIFGLNMLSPLYAQWVTQTSPTNQQLNSVCFVDAKHGWAVGNDGTIINTTNEGATWTIQTSTVTDNLYSVSFYDIKNGWAVGDKGDVLQTQNGGVTWNLLTLNPTNPYTNPLYSVQFTDSLNGWIAGGDTTASPNGNGDYFQYNGNGKWTQGTLNTTTPLQIFSLDPNNVWMLTTDGQQGYYFVSTTNGGKSWSTPPIGPFFMYVSSLFIINSDLGWAVGNDCFTHGITQADGGILKYNGSTWSVPDTFFQNNTFYSVYFTDANHGWAVGAKGAIINYNGSKWAAQTSKTTYSLKSVYFINDSTGCAVGQSGTILHTPIPHVSHNGINEIQNTIFNVQTYPNPCKDNSTIAYQLSENSFVNMKMYDVTGNLIANLVNEQKAKGAYKITIDAANLKDGIYFCKMQAGQYSDVSKIIVIK